jgi:hypothetical protein
MRITALLLTSVLFGGAASADLIVPQTASSRILIPAAGSAGGQNGTFFRSDIQVLNFRTSSQRLLLYWLPQGSSGAGIAPRSIELPAGSGFFSDDFVRTVMLQEGVGAIELVGVTSDGQFDPNAQLYVTSRIWTPRPDGVAGTMSQTFPAIVMPGSTARVKSVFGIRRTNQYRLNVGVTNPSQTTHHYRITARLNTGTSTENAQIEIDVQPRSVEQRNMTLTSEGVAQVLIEDLTAGTTTDWQGWASSIDNESGDAWSHVAFPLPAQQ